MQNTNQDEQQDLLNNSQDVPKWYHCNREKILNVISHAIPISLFLGGAIWQVGSCFVNDSASPICRKDLLIGGIFEAAALGIWIKGGMDTIKDYCTGRGN